MSLTHVQVCSSPYFCFLQDIFELCSLLLDLIRLQLAEYNIFFFFSSRRRHTRCSRDWSSDVCSSDLPPPAARPDPRRVRAVAGDRGQDRGPARARSDGAAHGLRAPRTRRAMRIFVEAPARLHFGVLDLRGDLGRRFGGIGAAVPAPSLLLEARPAGALDAEGPPAEAERVLAFARRFAAHHGIAPRVRFCVHRAIPAHAGLGSGTQLALAVARAIAELHGLSPEVSALARAVDRGRRSAIGTWTFAYGGFVLEGGRRPGADGVAPLLARLPMPPAWRSVVVVPRGQPGLAGDEEAAAFARLPPPPARGVEI